MSPRRDPVSRPQQPQPCTEWTVSKSAATPLVTTVGRQKRLRARDLADEHEHVVPALERRLWYLAVRAAPSLRGAITRFLTRDLDLRSPTWILGRGC